MYIYVHVHVCCVHIYCILVHVGAVAILTCAAEFNPQMSQVIKARPSDDFEITEVCGHCFIPCTCVHVSCGVYA